MHTNWWLFISARKWEPFFFAAVDPYQNWQCRLCWRPGHREVDCQLSAEHCHWSGVWAAAMWLVGNGKTGMWSKCCQASQDRHPLLEFCQKMEVYKSSENNGQSSAKFLMNTAMLHHWLNCWGIFIIFTECGGLNGKHIWKWTGKNVWQPETSDNYSKE